MKTEDTDIKIRISRLSTGLHEYHFSADPRALGLEENFTQPVLIDAVLEKTTRQLYLRAEITTSGMFPCDRCLDELELAVRTRFQMFYVFDELDAGTIAAEDVRIIHPDAMYLDLTDDVRETVTLAVPLKRLCHDECRGLCPECGINRNRAECAHAAVPVDPRWDDLKKFLNK